jgi:hypothetical protein
MKTLAHLFIITLFGVLSWSRSAKADIDIPDGSAIPANQWEIHPEVGTAVAMQLGVGTAPDKHQFNYLVVYIKNVSTSNSYLLHAGGRIGLMKIFYIDSQGGKHYLRNYHPSEINNGGTAPLVPGQICHQELDLNANELTFVLSHPMQCSFFIQTPPDGNGPEIVTSPKQLYLPQ